MYGGNGLGQTDAEFLGARDILLRMINELDAQIAGLVHTPSLTEIRSELDKAKRWFKSAIDRFYREGNNRTAGESLGIGLRHAQTASALIRGLDPRDRIYASAQAQAERRSSFRFQVHQTMMGSVTEPFARAIENISPTVAEALRLNWWIVPVVGSGLFILLLRR